MPGDREGDRIGIGDCCKDDGGGPRGGTTCIGQLVAEVLNKYGERDVSDRATWVDVFATDGQPCGSREEYAVGREI
jgi:hypothetical protein